MAAVTRSKAKITVRFDHVGLHCWPGATEHRSYLRHLHRHVFKVAVSLWVDHDDRDIEFHDLCDDAKRLFAAGFFEEDSVGFDVSMARSCEMMAAALGEQLVKRFNRQVDVTVSEDGEFDASVSSYPPYSSAVIEKETARADGPGPSGWGG